MKDETQKIKNATGKSAAPGGAALGVGVGKTARGVALFYAVSLLLSAPSLEENAFNMEYGKSRDICMKVIKPFADFSRACRFDYPRRAVASFRRAWLDGESD